MRAEEDAILVGTNTAQKDNPSLTVRHCAGKNPLRIVIDKNIRLPETLNLFDNSTNTLVLNSRIERTENKTTFIKFDFERDIIDQLLEELYNRNILSLIVEGGRQLLESLIKKGIWDEAHVYTGHKNFNKGIPAPEITGKIISKRMIESDSLTILSNPN